jgi:anti-anti-sigma factor
MSTTLSPVTMLAHLDIAPSRPSPATARVAVIGEVDLATAPVLRDQLLGVLHDYGPDVLDVDLGGVTFLDCAGVGALVGVRNAAVQAGRQIRVAHPQPIVRRILEVTGLLGVLTAPTDQRSPQQHTSWPASRAEDLAVPGVVVNETDVGEHHCQERGNRDLPPSPSTNPVQPAANSAPATAIFVR